MGLYNMIPGTEIPVDDSNLTALAVPLKNFQLCNFIFQ